MCTRLITEESIQRILVENPDLFEIGWRYANPDMPLTPIRITPDFVMQVRTGIAYLTAHRIIHVRRGSYGLKHLMEEWGKANGLAGYVRNSAGIIAAMLYGYYPLRSPYSGPNCRFRLHKIIKESQSDGAHQMRNGPHDD